MAFYSILDKTEINHDVHTSSAYTYDLNLDQVIDKISKLWGQKLGKLYEYFPPDLDSILYRRGIYSDIIANDLYPKLCRFVELYGLYEKAAYQSGHVTVAIQTKYWHILSIVNYCEAFEYLYEILNRADIKSEGLKLLHDYLRDYLGSEAYLDFSTAAKAIKNEVSNLKLVLKYNGDKITITEGEVTPDMEDALTSVFNSSDRHMTNPFTTSDSLSALEIEIYLVLREIKTDLFTSIEKFYKKHEKFADPTLEKLNLELPFYLSFRKFELDMNKNGYTFSMPCTENDGTFYAKGLYDLALACVNIYDNKPVIRNDFEYRDGESFFVLTGPNQGGKTTFARSLGQLVFFAKMGLHVPALEAVVPYFEDILTHFSVEESSESGRGKLMEELIRLAPMMEGNKSNSFVIINELFTTAANYDASIMGKQVLAHFIENQCTGIYVTHIKELSEGHDNIVSLRAMLDENNIQSFRILRAPASEDACAINQINKYRLNYTQLRERLHLD